MSSSAHNKRIVIIAGPNGAGKTTFARARRGIRPYKLHSENNGVVSQ